MELTKISIRKYADTKGVTDGAIRKMRGNRLSEKCFGIDPNNNRPFIWKELADVDWIENFDPAYANRVTKADKNAIKNGTAKTNKGTSNLVSNNQYQENKAKKEKVEYELAALRLLEKQGILVQKSKVYEALYAFGANIRKHFQDIPDKHLDNILAASDRDEAMAIFTTAIDEALISLTTIDTAVQI